MNSGDLRHRICIESKVTNRNVFGEEEVTWTPFFYAWASVSPLTGREYFAMQQTQAKTTHRITMRYRADIKPYHRITWDGRIFDIDAILNEDERNISLVIFATEEI